jgi:hypothetical protein
MNKTLATLVDRLPTWPAEAQDEAARALSDIEQKHIGDRPPSEQQREAKLAALRDTINRAIERGGSYTDEEVAASTTARLDAWEGERRGS